MIDEVLDSFNCIDDMLPGNRFIPIEDFNEALKYCATLCVQQPFNMLALWEEFFYNLVEKWRPHVEFNIEMEEAIYLLYGAAYNAGLYRNDDSHELCVLHDYSPPRSDVHFWYKVPDELKSLPKGVQSMSYIYMITIVIFETINYRCWHNYHVGVELNRESILELLEYGEINIYWDQY